MEITCSELLKIFDLLKVSHLNRIDQEWAINPTFTIQRETIYGQVEDCGKGINISDAFFSCLFEAIERNSAELFNPLNKIIGRYSDIKNDRKIIKPSEFENLIIKNQIIADECELSWCTAKNLFSNEKIYIPVDLVAFPYKSQFHIATTTGLAANITYIEAILHAIYELIEHDTISIYNYIGLPGREIIIKEKTSINGKLIAKLKKQGINIHIQFLDNDLHVPTVLALADDIPQMPHIKVAGIGCNLDPQIAARRAITECTQSASFWYKKYSIGDMEEKGIYHPILCIDNKYSSSKKPISLEDIPNYSSNNIFTDFEYIKMKLLTITSAVYVVDISRPEIGYPSVRVIIPAFEDLISDIKPRPNGRASKTKEIVAQYINVGINF